MSSKRQSYKQSRGLDKSMGKRKNNPTQSYDKLFEELENLRRRNAELKQHEFEASRYKSLLKEAETKFFLLVQNLPDIIYLLDENGTISFISNTINQYGYSSEELIGTSIIDIVHPEDKEKAWFRIKERRRGDRSTKMMEIRFVKKNEDVIHLELKDRDVDEFPMFSISAEGQYISSNGDGDVSQFIGTLGVAREVSHRRSLAVDLDIKSSRLPICSSCSKIRDDNGGWVTVEQFFKQHSEINFTHSICPVCTDKVKKPE